MGTSKYITIPYADDVLTMYMIHNHAKEHDLYQQLFEHRTYPQSDVYQQKTILCVYDI